MTTSPSRTSNVGCDPSEMYIIHGLMRHLFSKAPGLVRGVPKGDRPRTEVIADHIAEISAGLHLHHHTEDTMLWDTLESRSPGCALHVSQMKTQHQEISRLLDRLDAEVPTWRASASAADRDRVVSTLDEVLSTLERHLGQEEEQILPVAATTMSQDEWDQLGRVGMSEVPRDRLLIQLGMMLHTMPADKRAGWLKTHVPPIGRLLYTLLGRRQFERHYLEVYGVPVTESAA